MSEITLIDWDGKKSLGSKYILKDFLMDLETEWKKNSMLSQTF